MPHALDTPLVPSVGRTPYPQVRLLPGTGWAAPAAPLLVVEDDPDVRICVQELLEQEGYPVVTATHGQEALELLRAGLRPRLILLDMMMPVMDGATFLGRVKADEALRDTPVLIASGSCGRVLDGAVGLLRKPFSLEALLRGVSRWAGPPVRR